MPPLPQDREFSRAIDLVYSCAIAPERWGKLPQALTDLTGDAAAWGLQVVRSAEDGRFNSNAYATNFDPEFLESYAKHYAALNPWIPTTLRLQPLELVHDYDMVERSAFAATEFYSDWVRPQGDRRFGVAMLLEKNNSGALMLSCNYSPRFEASVSPVAARLATQLAPHMRRAFDLSRLAERQLARRGTEMLDAGGGHHGCFTLDATGRLVECDATAAALLQRGDAVMTGRDGRLRFFQTEANRAFDERLASGGMEGGSFVALTESGTRVLARLVPMPSWESPEPVSTMLVSGRASLVLIVVDPRNTPETAGDDLRRLFELTRAETFVAVGLCDGLSLAEIASLRACSVNTVRNQLRSILEKTGTSRQAELVALVARHGL